MKKNFTKTARMLFAFAVLAGVFFTACNKDKDGDDGPGENHVRYNNHTFLIPSGSGYYQNEESSYWFYFEFETENGTVVEVNIDLQRDKFGSVFTLAEGATYWYQSVYIEFPQGNTVEMDGDNDDIEDIRSGTILVKNPAGNTFEIVVKATDHADNTFELKYNGTLRLETAGS